MAKKDNEPPKYPEIGARLTQFVEESGEPSARQFALKAGITASVLSNLMLGYSIPGGETLAALATAYPKFDTTWLLTGRSAGQRPAASAASTGATQPDPPTPMLRVNKDGEGEAYWKALAQERGRHNELLAELLRGAYGIRPADDLDPSESAREGAPKKAVGSEHAAEVVTAYQHREVYGLVRYASAATDHQFGWVDAALVEATMLPLATRVARMWKSA